MQSSGQCLLCHCDNCPLVSRDNPLVCSVVSCDILVASSRTSCQGYCVSITADLIREKGSVQWVSLGTWDLSHIKDRDWGLVTNLRKRSLIIVSDLKFILGSRMLRSSCSWEYSCSSECRALVACSSAAGPMNTATLTWPWLGPPVGTRPFPGEPDTTGLIRQFPSHLLLSS